MASGGPIIVPADFSRPVQVIDVRSSAGALVRGGLPTVLDALRPAISFGHFLRAVAEVAGFDDALLQTSDRWPLEYGVNYWTDEQSLPLWLPKEEQHTLSRAGKLFTNGWHSLEQALEAVLEDERHRGLQQEHHTGLSLQFERSLIKQL